MRNIPKDKKKHGKNQTEKQKGRDNPVSKFMFQVRFFWQHGWLLHIAFNNISLPVIKSTI
jgi:hypothetical protein